jgi:hypothetical protein
MTITPQTTIKELIDNLKSNGGSNLPMRGVSIHMSDEGDYLPSDITIFITDDDQVRKQLEIIYNTF